MKRAAVILVFASAASLALGGCLFAAHSKKIIEGTIIADADLARVVTGKTTLDDLKLLFGEPETTKIDGDTTRIAYRGRIESKCHGHFLLISFSDETKRTESVVFILKDNVVTDYRRSAE